MSTLLEIQNLEQINQVAQQFAEAMDNRTVFAFYGKMGAGKTTFIKALCEYLGVKDVINSPTFALVNEYWIEETEELLYHFDFYRIKNTEEAVQMGCEEYFESGNLCFIEWPEKIESLLPKHTVPVYIEETTEGSRILRWE